MKIITKGGWSRHDVRCGPDGLVQRGVGCLQLAGCGLLVRLQLAHLRNCDQESDSTATKGIYDFNSSGDSNGNVSDQDGNNGVCASKNTGGTINRHRTCEIPNWWPDECGNWAAT